MASPEIINLYDSSDEDEDIPPKKVPPKKPDPDVVDLTNLSDSDDEPPAPPKVPPIARLTPPSYKESPVIQPAESPSPPPTNRRLNRRRVVSSPSPSRSLPSSDDEEPTVVQKARKRRSLNNPEFEFTVRDPSPVRRVSDRPTQVHDSTNGPTLGPRKDRQIPITQPAHVKRRVKAMTFLSQNIKPTARSAPKLDSATVTLKKKSNKPSTTPIAKENLVKKVVKAPLEALVPSVPAASTGPCPRVARTPPSIPAQHEADIPIAVDNSEDLGLNSHSDMLPDMATTSATIQPSDTTIEEPQPYDPEAASRGAGPSSHADWYIKLPDAGWRSQANLEVLNEQSKKRKRSVMDDGPSKRQKQDEDADVDADADLSIHLDSLMDVLKPKKTDTLADFANKDEDQPITEPVFPSPMNSEEEIDELINDDADFREATPFDLEEKEAVNMSFEMQGVPESSPQRPSFITEEDDEDAPIESPEKPFVLSTEDIQIEAGPWTHVLEDKHRDRIHRDTSVVPNLERRSRIPEVSRHGQNETLNQMQTQDASIADANPPRHDFVDRAENTLKSLYKEFADVLDHFPEFERGHQRPGISPVDAPWLILQPFLRMKLELERQRLEDEKKLPRRI